MSVPVTKNLRTCPACKRQFRRGGRPGIACCSMECRIQNEAHPRLLDADWLREQYVTLEREVEAIAAEVDRSRKVVEKWLHRHGIPVCPRGKHKNCRRIKVGDPNPMTGRRHSAESRLLMSEVAKASGRLPYKAENGPPWKGKTGQDHPRWTGGHTPERQAFYATEEWSHAARTVYARDLATCQHCGKCRNDDRSQPFDIHHVVPFGYEPLRAVVGNLVLLCEPCHYWVHGRGNVGSLFIKPIPTQV